MTQEYIEKEAEKTVDYLSMTEIDDGEIDYEESNYEAGRRDSLEEFGKDLFVKGANWRIISMWHDAENTPKNKKMIIAIDKDERPLICGPFNNDWKDTVRIFGITIWAYIEDLIP